MNAIWEGSGNIQALDVLRAMLKHPAVLDAWFAELERGAGQMPELDQAIHRLKNELSAKREAEYQARRWIEQLALTWQGSLLVQQGNTAVTEAFVHSRLGGNVMHHYGSLPLGVDTKAIIQRTGFDS